MLGSDLRALRNLFRTRDGRGVLLGCAVTWTLAALGWLAIVGNFFGDRSVRDAVAARLDGDIVRMLHTVLLLLPLSFALAFAVPLFRAQLYTALHVPALLAAPVSSFALLLRAFVHGLCGWTLILSALVVPPVLLLADGMPWPGSLWLAVAAAAALAGLLAPLLACTLLLTVVLARWGSGPRLRRVLALARYALFVFLAVALVFGLLRGKDLGAWLGTWLAQERTELPWLLDAPAALPAMIAGFAQDVPRLLSPLLLLALAGAALLLAAPLYRPSFDVHCSSPAPPSGRRTRRRDWPAGPLRSFLAKTLAETLRVGGSLAFYALLATVLLLVLSQGVTLREHEASAPRVLHESFFLLARWHAIAAVLSMLLCLAVIGGEQEHIALLASSPVPRRALLWAKAIHVALPLLVLLLFTAAAGPPIAGTSLAATGVFLLAAPGILLYVTGVMLAAGTWPRFVRVHEQVPLASSLRTTVPVLLTGVAVFAPFLLGQRVRGWFVASYYGRGPFADYDGAVVGALLLCANAVLGAAVLAAAYWLAARNLERLLGAQD